MSKNRFKVVKTIFMIANTEKSQLSFIISEIVTVI